MKNIDIPLIHLFVCEDNYFVYDTNTNKLINVSKEIFIELHKLKNIGIMNYGSCDDNNHARLTVLQLMYKGYFAPSNLKKIEFPHIEYVPDLLNRSINKIILQITRDCNFNCRYCAFSGNGEYHRTHEKKRMDFSTAKSAIDFLSNRSVDTNKVYITFYGGEPFLEFDLIKKCINYATSTIKSKDIVFNATINASVLDNNIINFLKDVSFDLLISLDGPEEIHNNNRRFRNNGKGTYKVVMKNIRNLMDNHKEYFNNHVTFNAVILSNNKLSEIENFFINELGVSENKIKIQYADLSGVDYLQDIQINSSTDALQIEMQDNILSDNLGDYTNFHDKLLKNDKLLPVWQHNGPCLPGVQRLFINCEGEFLPCEKAFETSNCLKIGDLYRGFNIDKIYSLLNVGLLSQDECSNCWAKRFCNICAIKCVDFENDTLSHDKKIDMCKYVQSETLNNFKKYIRKEMIEI